MYVQEENHPEPSPTPVINQPPPDANMVLKYTYGVNAWKHWVVNKNQQLQQASTGRSRQVVGNSLLLIIRNV